MKRDFELGRDHLCVISRRAGLIFLNFFMEKVLQLEIGLGTKELWVGSFRGVEAAVDLASDNFPGPGGG